ncbi:MAG TPA: hypothetical protein PKG95_08100 [Anaerolineaceae bacterium]|nr:hypothetical protein [Anaerolineaceae bacterium]
MRVSIGQAAKELGVSIPTLRLWEAIARRGSLAVLMPARLQA